MSNGEVTNEEVTVELTAFVRMFLPCYRLF